MRSALVLTMTNPTASPRPLRMIEYLGQNEYTVDMVSYPFQRESISGVREHLFIKPPRYDFWSKVIRNLHELNPILTLLIRSSRFRDWAIDLRYELQSLHQKLKNRSYDLLVVHDLFLLPLALRYKKNAKVLFDAREYYPLEHEEIIFFRWVEKFEREWLCRDYLPNCDACTTVSPGLKQRYEQKFDTTFHLYRSLPNKSSVEYTPKKSDQIRMVHHGGAQRNRKLEKMIEITKQLDESFTLDLYLTADQKYIDELKEEASDCSRVRFCEPVAYKDIIPMLQNYHIGFFYVEPATFNLLHCLPNKLFEYIHAGLMTAIGPSPDMAEIVHEYQCGIVADEFTVESMVRALNQLTVRQIEDYRKNSVQAASTLNYEHESKELDLILKNLLGKKQVKKVISQ